MEKLASEDVWVFVERDETPEPKVIHRDNLHRLNFFIEKLPVVLGDHITTVYDFPIC